jgi:hypothetical protein
VWVLFLEAAFAMMVAGRHEIDLDCYGAIDGGFPHVCIMGLIGGSFGSCQHDCQKACGSLDS